MKTKSCKHSDGCAKPALTAGWCAMHYSRINRHGDPGPVGKLRDPANPNRTCVEPGCENKTRGPRNRRCRDHLSRKPCSFDACENYAERFGLCPAHALQQKNGQELRPVQKKRARSEKCDGPDCDRERLTQQHCPGHHQQLLAGKPLTALKSYRGQGEFVECAFEECESEALSLGYCNGHYLQHAKGQELRPVIQRAAPGTITDQREYHRQRSEVWRARNSLCPDCRALERKCDSCKAAKRTGFNVDRRAVVYVVASDRWIKLGITNTPGTRLPKHARRGLHVIHKEKVPKGNDALHIERQWREFIKSLPKSQHATQDDIPDGFTETVKRTRRVERWLAHTFQMRQGAFAKPSDAA